MKRMVILTVLLALMLIACGRKTGGMDDSCKSCPFNQTAASSEFLVTESADYCIAQGDGIRRICVRPAGSDQFVPLCGKPNCTHNDRNCNAWAEFGLGFHRNRLYTTVWSTDDENPVEVVSMRPDGTDRKTELRIPGIRLSDGRTTGYDYLLFHGGKLLLVWQAEADIPLAEQIPRICCVDLETKEITQPFAGYFTPMIRPAIAMRPVGNCIYDLCHYQLEDGSVEEWIVEMDLGSGAVRQVLPVTDLTMSDSYCVYDGTMYYAEPGVGFMELDLETGELVNKGMPVENVFYAYRCADMIYAFSCADQDYAHCTAHFLTTDYHLLDTLELPENVVYFARGGRYLYFRTRLSNGFQFCLEPSAIGTGELKLRSLVPDPEPTEEPAETETPPFVSGPTEGRPAAAGRMCGWTVAADMGTFVLDNGDLDLLFLIPRGETAMKPVCGKADCNHSSADCGACLGLDCHTLGIGWFRDRLWYAVRENGSLGLYSLEPDSGQRRKEMTVTDPGYSVEGGLFHENTLMAVFREDVDVDACMHVKLVDLPSGTIRTAGTDYLNGKKYPGSIGREYRASGGQFFAVGSDGSSGSMEYICQLDIAVGRITELIPTRETENGDSANILTGYDVTDGEIRYAKMRGGLWSYKRDTGQLIQVSEGFPNAWYADHLDGLVILECTGRMVYSTAEWFGLSPEQMQEACNQKDYYFLTWENELLDELHFSDGTHYVFAAEDALYFRDAGERYCFVLREQIGTGEMALTAIS